MHSAVDFRAMSAMRRTVLGSQGPYTRCAHHHWRLDGETLNRAVNGDAVARVDVPVPGPELQLRLVDEARLHDGSHSPASRPASAGAGAGGSGGGSHAFSSIAASASMVSRPPNRIRSSLVLNKVSSPWR